MGEFGNEIEWIKSADPRQLAPPGIDVTQDVMQTLRDRADGRSMPTQTLLTFAVAGWSLAAVAIFAALHLVSQWQDPLADLLRL